MQYKPTRSLCATAAIAATLALGSTPAFAQETAPAISAPAAPAPVAAAPTVVLPPVTVQPTAPQPVAEAAPEPAARPAPRAQASRPAPKAAPKPAAAAASAPVAAAPIISAAPAPVAATPVETTPQTPLDTAPAPVAEASPAAQTDNGLNGEEIGFLALLAALGLGGAAFAVTGLRRRRRLNDAETVEAVEYAADPVPVVAPTVGLKPPVTMQSTTVRARPTFGQQPVYALSENPGMPETLVRDLPPAAPAESVSIPDGPVPTGDDRQDLLDEMVAAEPDEANPFTSAKARRKRARLILQARESEQPSDNTGEPFDWRTYETPKVRETEPA